METNIENNKAKTKNIIIVILAILLVVMVIILLTIVGNKKESENHSSSSKQINKTDYSIKVWNNTKYKPEKQFIIENEENNTCSNVEKYTNVATLNDDSILIRADFRWFDDSGHYYNYFIINKSGNIKTVARDLDNICLMANVNKEGNITIPEIGYPKTIVYENVNFEFVDYYILDNSSNKEIKSTKKLTDINNGTLYKETVALVDNENILDGSYVFINGDKSVIHYYTYNDQTLNDDQTLNIEWQDEKNSSLTWNYFSPNHCSANPHGSGYYINNFDTNKGVEIAKTRNDSKIYKINDDSILKLLHIENGTTYDPVKEETVEVSYNEYKNNLSAITYKDVLGNWRILLNRKYASGGECGKPVIYLYPEVESKINVTVGANVTISDPLYPKNGWKNVYAKPNGELTYNGKKYDSLFWEGLGYGQYPKLYNVGKVVTQENLFSTIEKDLYAQGLNKKEVNDFMEFWTNNLPKTPYIKIAWFTKEQMNELAPLRVNPQPDTVIRVFLEAKGLLSPIDLIPQKLDKIERKGFTLVEWGGLLNK